MRKTAAVLTVFSLFCILPRLAITASPTPAIPYPTPPPDCGCVGATQTFAWGDTITEDCTLNCDLSYAYTCFTIGTDNITIDGAGYTISCLERNNPSYGLYLNGRSNVTIRNIGIEEFNYGIYARDCESIDILDSVISDNQWWEGIEFYNTNNSMISGNTLEGNGLRTGGDAIRFVESSFNQITGNTIDNNGRGIYLYNSSDNNITGNLVTNSYEDGILIRDSDDNSLNSNKFCSNVWSWDTTSNYSDIRVRSGSGNAGVNNFCDTTYDYNDTGTTGCTFSCSSPVWIYDYNGDGTSDIAIFRAGSGLWAIRSVTRVYFGGSADETVPGDYDGDGTTDIGIFRISSGLWAIRSVTRAYFGGGSDLPRPGDYDGDGTADIGIFRPTSGLWAIRGVTRAYFGGSTDEPIPGYYDADGSKDIGLFRPASGLWAIRGVTRIYFGGATDEPIPGDYNGDGVWDVGIFRPASGLWAVSGVTRSYFGGTTDEPLPADYSGSGTDDPGIFRGNSGLWAAKGVTRIYFGGSSDTPVVR